MTTEPVQMVSTAPAGAVDAQSDILEDITTKVSSMGAAPSQKLDRLQSSEGKLPTSLNGISLAFLAKFVLPLEDSSERPEPWTSKDINLM